MRGSKLLALVLMLVACVSVPAAGHGGGGHGGGHAGGGHGGGGHGGGGQARASASRADRYASPRAKSSTGAHVEHVRAATSRALCRSFEIS